MLLELVLLELVLLEQLKQLEQLEQLELVLQAEGMGCVNDACLRTDLPASPSKIRCC